MTNDFLLKWSAPLSECVIGAMAVESSGVDENENGAPNAVGLTNEQLISWSYDDLANSIDEYSDPNVIFDLETFPYENKRFVEIRVQEFDDIPVLCNKTYDDVLRKGACYVRPRRKPETTEIPTQADMRDLLELAIEKRLRNYLAKGLAAGWLPTGIAIQSDGDRFDEQANDLLG